MHCIVLDSGQYVTKPARRTRHTYNIIITMIVDNKQSYPPNVPHCEEETECSVEYRETVEVTRGVTRAVIQVLADQ